jgi:hypothetical protein
VLLAGLTGALAACSSSPATAPAPAHSASALPVASALPSAPASPPPSDGFTGPSSFTVTWTDAAVTTTPCAKNHPTALCYTGTASATLPVIGDVTLDRTIIVGDETGTPPSGCVTEEIDGTLTNPDGVLHFIATGNLCGRTSSTTVVSSAGTGSLADYTLHAQITNDSIAETWFGEIVTGS